MKGVIPNCLGEFVKKKYGMKKWGDCLETAGLNRNTIFLLATDIDDNTVFRLVDSSCRVLDMSFIQFSDAFGDFWMNVYAPRIYRNYFTGANSAKEFLLKMDGVNVTITKNIQNALPPRFDYEWKDDNLLIMRYKSRRGLIDFVVGLVKGVGKHYREHLIVRRISDSAVEIIFPK